MKGIIQFDYGYQRESIFVPVVRSHADLTTFTDAIKRFSNAGIRKIASVHTEYFNESGSALISHDVDVVLLVLLRYIDADKQERTTTLAIPAPKRDLLVFKDGRGYRLPEAQGRIIATAYTTLTGRDHTFLDGWVLG